MGFGNNAEFCVYGIEKLAMPTQELIIGQIQIWVSISYEVLCFRICFSPSHSNHRGTWKGQIKIVTFKCLYF